MRTTKAQRVRRGEKLVREILHGHDIQMTDKAARIFGLGWHYGAPPFSIVLTKVANVSLDTLTKKARRTLARELRCLIVNTHGRIIGGM